MESHFPPTRDDFYQVKIDVKHVQAVQTNHADRILRLEKRQADDAALKSVWNSPFPNMLGGTPQQGPDHKPSAEIFDGFDDEHGQNLLGSLQLDAEDEPVRRGASRANSVRFDVSAIQGSTCGQGSRSSGEFGPLRPASGLGSHPMTDRSLSHKSDGRHSSAGHSVHSIHSAPSGRTSSLGLYTTNFLLSGHNNDSSSEIPEPPPGLFILGTVPSIIRCWLNENFSHNALLYAAVCTGSQNSHIDISLLNELGLMNRLQKNVSGNDCVRLSVYLPEALVTQSALRTNSQAPQLPTVTATFNVIGVCQRPNSETRRAIGIFLGSDTLRAYSADILFSQNLMALYGDDRSRLSVPFVRPEDDSLFKNLCTTVAMTQKIELNATALPFTPIEKKPMDSACVCDVPAETVKAQIDQLPTNGITSALPTTAMAIHVLRDSNTQKQHAINSAKQFTASNFISSEYVDDSQADNITYSDYHQHRSPANYHTADISVINSEKRESPGSIWGTWRTGGFSNNEGETSRERISASNFQRPSRGGKCMQVLRPSKTSQRGRSSSAARTGASYEPPIQRISEEFKRKTQAGTSNNETLRWEAKRTVSDGRPRKEPQLVTNISRSNPIGGASAFAWMNPGKAIITTD